MPHKHTVRIKTLANAKNGMASTLKTSRGVRASQNSDRVKDGRFEYAQWFTIPEVVNNTKVHADQ